MLFSLKIIENKLTNMNIGRYKYFHISRIFAGNITLFSFVVMENIATPKKVSRNYVGLEAFQEPNGEIWVREGDTKKIKPC